MVLVALSWSTSGMVSAGEAGKMTREIWLNVPGGKVSDFTSKPRYWQQADSTTTFSGSAAPSRVADNFASRVRAWVKAPATGNYTFWIAADDTAELWLSPTASKFGRVRIAYQTGPVNTQAWDAKTTQKSASKRLVAGQRYFIEALHKEAAGSDHLAIAWQAPGGTRQLIPATALESFTADPNDADNDELRDDWETANGFSITDNGTANPSQLPLADPDHDGYSNLEECEFDTNPNQRGGVPGTLLLETWNGIQGGRIDDLTYHARYSGTPDRSEFIYSAETPANRADNFGARMRGYVIAPKAGTYTFYLAGDNTCLLWLSPTGNQFAKEKAATVSGATAVREWTKATSQKSKTYTLTAGQRVYLEAVQKEASGADHMAIGWKLPGATAVTVIPGSALESYAYDANDADGDNMPDDWEALHGLDPLKNDAAGDPDMDGIQNHLEAAKLTNPQVKNSIGGALLHELWWNVPGFLTASLDTEPRLLAAPNMRALATRTQGFSFQPEHYAQRLRGYLTAPVTGSYTFWAAGDDQADVFLSTSESKYAKELLIRTNTIDRGMDSDISQKSRAVRLVAGRKYYFEIRHIDGHGWDFCDVAWQKPGGTREIIPGNYLSSYIPTADDLDDDNLPDAYESANGLSPTDNGRINPSNGACGDLDGDGLSNAAEFKAGTRADLADTDGDGVNDRDEIEILETQALMADAAPFQSVTTIPGANYSATSGEWQTARGMAFQYCLRGWVEYPVQISAAGIYQLDLSFQAVADMQVCTEHEIVLSINGQQLRRDVVTVEDIATGHVKALTPWLPAGTHTVRVFMDNSYWFRRAAVEQLEVLSAQGPDANSNGRPDWVDARLARYNSFEAPAESISSPVCVEGKAKWSALTTIPGATVRTAPNDRWYANVPLSDTQPTSITAALENGALPVNRKVTWVAVNLLTNPTLTVRKGDSLKLSAFKGNVGTPQETVTITVEGETATFASDHALVHAFNKAGTIPIQIKHTQNGTVTTQTATINVLAAPTLTSPVCVVGFLRTVDFPALPAGVTLQLDNRIHVQETRTASNGTTTRITRLNTLDNRTAILRLNGSTGPILSQIPFRAMRIRDGEKTGLYIEGALGKDQWDLMMPVVVDGNYSDTSIIYEIFTGGCIFDDGKLKRTLLPGKSSSFQWDTVLHFYKTGLAGSNCHRVSIWQGTKKIAYYY